MVPKDPKVLKISSAQKHPGSSPCSRTQECRACPYLETREIWSFVPRLMTASKNGKQVFRTETSSLRVTSSQPSIQTTCAWQIDCKTCKSFIELLYNLQNEDCVWWVDIENVLEEICSKPKISSLAIPGQVYKALRTWETLVLWFFQFNSHSCSSLNLVFSFFWGEGRLFLRVQMLEKN